MEYGNKLKTIHKHQAEKQIGRKEYQKRYYSRLRDFWTDFRDMLSRRDQIKQAFRGDLVSPAFRERLMLAVTEVNQCRYCRTFHVQQAFQVGVSREEIQIFVAGSVPEDIPAEEITAVRYAKYWAENNAQPDVEAQERIREEYGEDRFAAIQNVLRMIRWAIYWAIPGIIFFTEFPLVGGGYKSINQVDEDL